MNLLRSKTASIREKRLQAIAACYNMPDALAADDADRLLVQRVRTFSQDVPSDIHYALKVIATIRDAAVVVHGASGCATAFHIRGTVSNLNERDSIMGGDRKLREAIRQTYQTYHPSIIFTVTTPLVAINNDDVDAVVEELKEELNIPIVPVYTDGFRSKIGATGYDVLAHAILKHMSLSRGENAEASVNLLSVSENKADLEEAQQLLCELGLSVNVFPQATSPDVIRRLSDATFSLSISPDDADYPGTVLQERFGVPFVKPQIPVGIANTEAWLKEAGQAAGVAEKAGRLIDAERKTLDKFLSAHRPSSLKIFLNLPPAPAFGVYDLLRELGYEVVGLKTTCLDVSHLPQLEKLRASNPGCYLSIGEGQLFEEENIFRKTQPELYIGRDGDYSAAIRNGIPALNLAHVPTLGFRGAVNLTRRIERTASHTSFTQRLARIETETYTGNWLKRTPNWYIKQEVK